MANIPRPTSTAATAAAGAALAGLLALVCVAIALGALWMMLEAAVDSDWWQVACMVVLWTAAVGMTYLLVPPQNREAGLDDDLPASLWGDQAR
jgi:hypothetical protein